MFDIITIGSATRDTFMSAEEFKKIKDPSFKTGEGLCLPLGSKIEIEKIVFTTGGGGTNAAVTFARQGLNTACISVIGQDLNGQDILDSLNKEGINTDFFQKHDDDATAYSVILVDKGGERTILSYKGEGQHFDASKVPFEKLESKWLMIGSLGGHYDLLEKSVSWAKEKGVKITANPGTKELEHGLGKLKILLENSSIVIMNQEEAAGLTGIDYNPSGRRAGGEDKIFKFMDKITDGIFVMTKGPEGVVVSDGQNIYRAGVPNSPVVERTGAGDAFTSGFTVEYVRAMERQETSDRAIVKAIQFGTANASSVVTKYGAKRGILKKDDWGPWDLVEVSKE